jgi:hypothetical protein
VSQFEDRLRELLEGEATIISTVEDGMHRVLISTEGADGVATAATLEQAFNEAFDACDASIPAI